MLVGDQPGAADSNRACYDGGQANQAYSGVGTSSERSPPRKRLLQRNALGGLGQRWCGNRTCLDDDGGLRGQRSGSGLTPSAALAAVIGAEPVARTEVVKKLWDYIKANGLQDAKDKRSINADAKLLPVFGKPQVTMFEIAGIVGKHLA